MASWIVRFELGSGAPEDEILGYVCKVHVPEDPDKPLSSADLAEEQEYAFRFEDRNDALEVALSLNGAGVRGRVIRLTRRRVLH